MARDTSRRDFLKISGATLTVGSVGAMGVVGSVMAAAPAVSTGQKADLPKAKGPRLVVVGGGTSGLTIAKYAKKAYPKFDVILVEKREMYSSCFFSNLWYPNLIDLEFLANHSFLDAAVNNGYIYFPATAIGLDRESKILATNQGDIRYDFLVVAPGIAYDYDKIGVTDIENEIRLRQTYPAGFAWTTEHVTIHRKVNEFEGGVFVQTVPSGNYRCLPAPYERACLVAAVIKQKKLNAKVLILDANPEITIKAEAFHNVFDSMYKDVLEWIPSVNISGVDVDKRQVSTTFDTYDFDEAAIYPNIRASKLIEKLGLMAPPERSAQKEADIDVRFYNIVGDPYVYVTGDSRRQPYSKSGNTSNSEAHYVAKVLAARAQGKDISWVSPETICYSVVSADPMQAISVDARYVYDKGKDAITGFSDDTVVYGDPDVAKGLRAKAWAEGMYRDMFEA